MEADRMKRSLSHLGIQPADYRVLKLLPLIYVAWADGKMDEVKKERIHLFAARSYDLSASALAVLNRWLTERPSKEYISEALHDIFLLAKARDDMEFDFSELPGLLFYAETVATAAGAALGERGHASLAVETALGEIASELGIDHGESWALLLDELG
ncbi:MAG TPA: hypothetical protein VHP33_40825 [Polyangiaceae bacterium]|nr:hypothetical protein [Polyangiaceae bacterium]